MKQILILTIGLAISFQIQAHEKIIDKNENPFSFEASYVGDAVRNFSGGIKKGSTYLAMANIVVGLNTKKAGLWKGGDLFLNGAHTYGGEPTAKLIGDYQVASNIEAGELTYLHELWYRQNVGKASFIIGLQDLVVEFLSSKNAGVFLNSSFGVHSTIATNLTAPIFPLTSLGAQLHYNFNDNFKFKAAIFDGVPDDFSINRHNTKWKLSQDDSYLLFSELSFFTSSTNKPGIYKIGTYFHNDHTAATQDEGGLTVTQNHPKNYGFYVVVDQIIYKNLQGKELSFFSQASLSPRNVNENWSYIGCGLCYKGPILKRMQDILSIGFAHSAINNDIGSETTIELTYQAQLGDGFFIQPDFQYIINPAGTETVLNNSFVGFVRLGINF